MKYYLIYECYFPASFFLVGIWLCWIALRGIQEKRPILFSAKVSFAFFALFTAPFVVLSTTIITQGPRNTNFDSNEIGLILIPILLILSWHHSRGFNVVGATRETIDRALAQTAAKLKLAYDAQSLSLKPAGDQTALRGLSWATCGYVRLASSLDGSTRREIRRELNSQLADLESNVRTSAYSPQFAAASALFIAGIALYYMG